MAAHYSLAYKNGGDGDENVKKANDLGRFSEQNNDFVHASRFSANFLAVPAQLRREMTKF